MKNLAFGTITHLFFVGHVEKKIFSLIQSNLQLNFSSNMFALKIFFHKIPELHYFYIPLVLKRKFLVVYFMYTSETQKKKSPALSLPQ